MRKILSLLLAFTFAGQMAFAAPVSIDTKGKLRPPAYDLDAMSVKAKKSGDLSEYPQGLIFHKVAGPSGDLNADFAKGECVPVFTASRSATNPKTYGDQGGTSQTLTASNTPAIARTVYTETGKKRVVGLSLEGQVANEITYSCDFTQSVWVKSNITVGNDSVDTPAGTKTTVTLTASTDNGTVLYTIPASGTARTYSVFMKRKTGTGAVSITSDGGSNYTECSLSSTDWRRFKVVNASANGVCGIKIATSGDAVYACINQFEDNLFPSSLIPTSGSSVTRNAENLSYYTKNNFPAVKRGDCESLDGTDDKITFGDVGNVSHIKIKFLSRPDNQEIMTLANSTATAVTVSGGTLTFGASLSASNITVDSVSKTAAQAGALINDNTWHTLEFDLTEIAASNLIIGTDSSAYGDIIVEQLVINSPATHTYNFNGNVNDSTGAVNGTISGATWTKDASSGTLIYMYRPEMLPSEQDANYKRLIQISIAAGINEWALLYDTNANNRIRFYAYSNSDLYIAAPNVGYCSFYTRFQRHILVATWDTTPFVVSALNSGNPIRMALYDGYETDGVFALHPIAYSVNYVPPVGVLPSTFSIQPTAGQGMIFEGMQIYDRCLDNRECIVAAMMFNQINRTGE